MFGLDEMQRPKTVVVPLTPLTCMWAFCVFDDVRKTPCSQSMMSSTTRHHIQHPSNTIEARVIAFVVVLAVRNYQFLVSITKRVHNVSTYDKGNSWFCQFINNGSESILKIAELLQKKKKNKGLFLFLIQSDH